LLGIILSMELKKSEKSVVCSKLFGAYQKLLQMVLDSPIALHVFINISHKFYMYQSNTN
jgi:hypothetical protein